MQLVACLIKRTLISSSYVYTAHRSAVSHRTQKSITDTARIYACSRCYVTVRFPFACLSVCLSVPSIPTAAAACGGFAARRPASRRYRSIAARRVYSSTAVSSKCEQCHVYSRRRRLDTDLYRTSATKEKKTNFSRRRSKTNSILSHRLQQAIEQSIK